MAFLEEVLQLLACPVCGGKMSEVEGGLFCPACQREFPVVDGIPVLLAGAGQHV
jgi:uncharacterized protein YbaR (Trm112 family)